MNEEKIREIIEQVDPKGELTQSIQEELIAALKEVKQSTPVTIKTAEDLKSELANESDWRKKASLAARLISLGLE